MSRCERADVLTANSADTECPKWEAIFDPTHLPVAADAEWHEIDAAQVDTDLTNPYNGLLAAAKAVRSGTFTRVACNHSELKKLLSFHHSPGSDACSLEMPASGNKNVMLIIGRTAQRFRLLPPEFEACIKVSRPLPGRRTYPVSPDKAGDVPAVALRANPDFQIRVQLYCRAIRKGCTSAQEIGIRASDLAYPNTLADGTLASNIYLISCRGSIVCNARGTRNLQSIHRTESPSPSCHDQHAAVNETDRCEHRYGMLRAADAEQYRQRQRNPSVMLKGPDALRAHASGLCQGPSLHPISTRHVAASAKRHVLGTGQSQALLLLEFQKGLFAAKEAQAVRECMRPAAAKREFPAMPLLKLVPDLLLVCCPQENVDAAVAIARRGMGGPGMLHMAATSNVCGDFEGQAVRAVIISVGPRGTPEGGSPPGAAALPVLVALMTQADTDSLKEVLEEFHCKLKLRHGQEVTDLFQGWQTDNDRAEMQAVSQVTQGLTLDQHRDLLESLLLQHKSPSELEDITVITADREHTIKAAVHYAREKLQFPEGTSLSAQQSQRRLCSLAIKHMLLQTDLLQLYKCAASVLCLADYRYLPLHSADIAVSASLPIRMVQALRQSAAGLMVGDNASAASAARSAEQGESEEDEQLLTPDLGDTEDDDDVRHGENDHNDVKGDCCSFEADCTYCFHLTGLPKDVFLEVQRVHNPHVADPARWGKLGADKQLLYIRAMPADIGDFVVVSKEATAISNPFYNPGLAEYVADTWLRLPTSWSFCDPRRHSALSTAGAAAETPVGLMKAYLGTRKQRAKMTVLELATHLLGNGNIPGYLPQQAARFGTCHQ